MKNWLAADLVAAVSAERRRWLVTGAAGFIGSNIVEALLELGQEVVGLDNYATGHHRNLQEVRQLVGEDAWTSFRMIEGDIRDLQTCEEAIEEGTLVLHQAALGSVPRSLSDPLTTHHVNVTGFLHMLDSARRRGAARFVYAASSSTYGDEPNLPKREDRIGNPLSPYAATKFFNEVYASIYARSYGFAATGLRYFNVFGPRQDPNGPYAAVIPKWVAAMLEGGEIAINGDGSTSRDFCFVANAVQANLRAALAPADETASVYNVAVGERTSLLELYQLLEGELRAQGHPYSGAPLHRPFRAGDVLHSLADIGKASTELGYRPTHDIASGIRCALPWYVGQAK